MKDERCDECGGLLDRPGLFSCEMVAHPQPSVAEKIARAIEDDIRDRRGLRQEFDSIDEDTQDEIRDTWTRLIQEILDDYRR